MFGLIGSRLLQAIPVLMVVGFIAFALFAFVGDPVAILLGQDHTEAQRIALVHQLGLDQPFYVQYVRFMWAGLHGDFGISYRLAQPVGSLLADRLPATLELAVTASVLAFAIGVPMGVYTGIHRDSLLSRVFMTGRIDNAADPRKYSASNEGKCRCKTSCRWRKKSAHA